MLTINEIKSIIAPLVKDYPVRRVILFGSYARGEATEASDVDLIVDSEGQLSYWDLLGIIGDIVKKAPLKVDVLGIEEIKKLELLDNIRNEGVVVYERTN